MDAVALAWANQLWYWARFDWGWLTPPVFSPAPESTQVVILLMAGYWLLVFMFYGLYRERYAASRFDELVTITKVVTIGILVLFFLFFIDSLDAYSARSNLIFYWGAIIVLVSAGRIVVRSFQKALILR